MITVKITSGLGNQLFQYAFGRSLSADLNTELSFDLSYFDTEYSKSLRHSIYALKLFNIKENIETVNFSNVKDEESSKHNYYQEVSFNELTGFPSLNNFNKIQLPAYFDGYWQSEKYFIHNEKIIRNDLQFKFPLNGKNKVIAEDILNHNSVAMHIRRGDYHKHPHFGMCDTDYYNKSVSFIEKQVENPKFYIFSDDHQWVKKNIHIPHPTYHITHNDVEKGYEDLRLMSLCKHFIIANSSFSWWGAWLSKNDDKIVTTPSPWFISRLPGTRYIDNGKHFYPITNDYSEVFNESSLILFSLNPSKYSIDIPSINNVDLKVDENMLNIQTLENDSKLYLKEIHKLNGNNEVIMKISLKTESSDLIRLYYTTENSSTYNFNNSFHSYYYENEDMDIYIYLSKEVLLTNLMIEPATIEGSNIIIKSLEIREIHNSKNYSSLFSYNISNTISKVINTEKQLTEIGNKLKKTEYKLEQTEIKLEKTDKQLNQTRKQLIEIGNKLKKTEYILEQTDKQLNQAQKQLKASHESFMKMEKTEKEILSQYDNLKAHFYETQYLNNNGRPIIQRIISWFPSLYILLITNKSGIKNALINIKGYQSIKKNHLLNIGYYLKNNSDVRISGKDPIIHFIYHGYNEGRKPDPTFDGDYYLKTHSDVKTSNLNPLVHYSLYGINEERITHNEAND